MTFRSSFLAGLGCIAAIISIVAPPAFADESSTPPTTPVTATNTGDATPAAPVELAPSELAGKLLARLERIGQELESLIGGESDVEAREVAEQCRELVTALRETLRAGQKLPVALEAIQKFACDGETCPIDGQPVANRDLQQATLQELFSKLREVEVEVDAEEEEPTVIDLIVVTEGEDEEPAEEIDLAALVAQNVQRGRNRGQSGNQPGGENAKPNDEQLDALKRRAAALAERLEQEKRAQGNKANVDRELEEFSQMVREKLRDAMASEGGEKKIDRLRDIAGAIRERAAKMAENEQGDKAFQMLKMAERIENQANEIARANKNAPETANLRRGNQDRPPNAGPNPAPGQMAGPRPGGMPGGGMPGSSGMPGVPPGMQGMSGAPGMPGMSGMPGMGPPMGMAQMPQPRRQQAQMAHQLLQAAGLKKEAQIVAEAIEREFGGDQATVERLRREINELKAINAKLTRALEDCQGKTAKQPESKKVPDQKKPVMKQIEKQPVKQPVKQLEKQPVKESAKQPVDTEKSPSDEASAEKKAEAIKREKEEKNARIQKERQAMRQAAEEQLKKKQEAQRQKKEEQRKEKKTDKKEGDRKEEDDDDDDDDDDEDENECDEDEDD